MIKTTLKQSGSEKPATVSLERRADGGDAAFVFCVGESRTEIEITMDAGGAGVIRSHARLAPIYAHRRDSSIEVWYDGRVYSFENVDSPARRATADGATAGRGGNLITAPMPGTILKILGELGDAIEAHAPLVIMESMKMEMTLSAPSAGRVKEIQCSVGDLVEMGKVLVKLEPAKDE